MKGARLKVKKNLIFIRGRTLAFSFLTAVNHYDYFMVAVLAQVSSSSLQMIE